MRTEHEIGDAPVIIAARRTPIATRGRALAALTVEQLAIPVARALHDDATAALGHAPAVADVVLGNCMGPGGNPARVAALGAGLGFEVPGLTIDRQCGSGLAAIIEAATAISAGDERPRIAGGVESASTAPTRSIDGTPYARAPFTPAGWHDPGMTQAAQDLATHDGIPRDRQDAYAARSAHRAASAVAAGRLDTELVRLVDAADRDEPSRPGFDRLLHRFTPLFAGGSLTAGNTCRVSDGAAGVLLVPGAGHRGEAPGLAIRAHAVIGCDPALPGIGAAPAIIEALDRAGLGVADIGAFEIVEAFAAQTLAVLDRLGIADDDERVCADGGALALGHPWGASGAVAVVRLFSRLVRSGAPAGTIGVAAASVGGGLGVAAVFEVVR
ncbi:MAG TPA: thiolase family protein [Plantibacter sp.]|uniref:thiolase family protein n=1 Tax=unclassified Plantibacter TaxID=2624265 RepID=UPI002B865A68|nr:thiolase family protein [Plantibacter sp.]